MPISTEKFRGLREGGMIRLELTNEQRKLLAEMAGVDAEYLVVSAVKKPTRVVHVQGHLADDALID